MASVTKRGKSWQYTVSRLVNGKSKPIRKCGFRTKKEATIAAAEVESNLQKGIIPYLGNDPFPEYFETWLEVYKVDLGKNTLARYKNTLESIKEHYDGVAIQSIDKRSYQHFLNGYGKTHGRATTKKLNSHIRACVKDALDEDIIRKDFTRNATITGEDPKKPEEKHLNYAESERLLKHLYDHLDKGIGYYLLLLGLTSGMRFGELVGLTRKDFNFVANTISINKTWGYTNKMHDGFGQTKNDQSVRTIKMDKKTMKVFKGLFANTVDNIHGLVFFSMKSKYSVYSNGAANKLLEAILKELGINTITVHGLRHTHISVLIYKKISIPYIAERVGHINTETTNTVYAHVIKEMRVEDEKGTTKVFEGMTG